MAISQNFPNTRPSLNLNFARSKTLDPRITFSRTNTTATYVDDNGLIVDAGVDEPRFDHDPTTGESLGLLVEEQRTNLVTNNEDLSQWTSNANGTITSNDTVSPDGNTTADKVTQTNQVYSGVYTAMSGITTNTVYSCSVFIKPDGDTRTRFGFYDTSNWQGALDTDWSSGEPSTNSSLGGASDIVYEEYPNGWYRASFKASTQSNAFAGTLQFHCHPDRTGTGKSAWFWGAQLEAGAFPTSYIPTSGSQVTRTADNVTMTGTNFSDWFNSSEGTIVVDSLVEYDPEATKFVYGIFGGSYDLSLRQPHLTGGRFRAVIGGTFSSAPGTGNNAVNGSTTKAAVAYTSSTGRLQVGDSGVDVTPGGAVDGNQLSIGAHNGRIKQLTYYPTRLSNTVLQTLTK